MAGAVHVWMGGGQKPIGACLARAAGQPEVRNLDNVVVFLPGEVASGRAAPDKEREEEGRSATMEVTHQCTRW